MDWFPHHIDDYDADTLELTLEQDGAYHRLLRWYYKHERPLPLNETALASICRITIEQWRLIAPVLLPFFVTRDKRVSHANVTSTQGQELVHKRCNEVIVAQSKKRRDAVQRQEKHRKNNILEPVTRDKRVSHAPRGEERRGDNITTTENITESGADAPTRKSPKTRLPEDWKPTAKDCDYAKSVNLTREETITLARAFHRYWTGPDAKNPRKSDWHRAWCNWVDRDAPRIIATRSSLGRGASHNGGGRSDGIVASANRVLAALDAEKREGHADAGFDTADAE